MKRFLIVLLPLLFVFASCNNNSQQRYLIVSADRYYTPAGSYSTGLVFCNKDKKTLSTSEKLAYNQTITLSWSLLPETTSNVWYNANPSNSEVKVKLSTDKYLRIIQPKDSVTSLTFEAIDVGSTVVTIESASYGSASVHIDSLKIE